MNPKDIVSKHPFLIDDRALVFVGTSRENLDFLKGIDPEYWRYQAAVHKSAIGSDDEGQRQRAATALRVAYGHGVEALVALLGAFVQAPTYPLGWISSYRNLELRSVAKRLQTGVPALPGQLAPATWPSIAAEVFRYVLKDLRTELSCRFAAVWEYFADRFLEDTFEPEYNTLKHGMRSLVGGFKIALGPDTTDLSPSTPDQHAPQALVGVAEYGSTFNLHRRIEGTSHSFEFHERASQAWVPSQFVAGLDLVAVSVRNIVSRLLIVAGEEPVDVRFEWPEDTDAYERCWKPAPSISTVSFRSSIALDPGYKEPSHADILTWYDTFKRQANQQR